MIVSPVQECPDGQIIGLDVEEPFIGDHVGNVNSSADSPDYQSRYRSSFIDNDKNLKVGFELLPQARKIKKGMSRAAQPFHGP